MKRLAVLLTLVIVATPLLADGKALYKSKCSACHGPDGAGQTTMGKKMTLRDLRSAEVQKQTDLELTKVIAGGQGKMPAYGKQLSTDDIQGLIAHLRTLK